VKSSTSVKEHYWEDVAIQYYVLSGCGIPLNRAYLVHINNGYVRNGDIVPEELFVIQDITGVVKEKQGSIPDTLAEMRAMLRGDVPRIGIGSPSSHTKATAEQAASPTARITAAGQVNRSLA
jgi:hypothetical protein